MVNVYSIEKANRYLRDILDRESLEFFAETIRDYYVGMTTPPAPSKEYARHQKKAWDKYLDTINPKTIKDKVKGKKNPLQALMQMDAVPKVVEPAKKAKSKESEPK